MFWIVYLPTDHLHLPSGWVKVNSDRELSVGGRFLAKAGDAHFVYGNTLQPLMSP